MARDPGMATGLRFRSTCTRIPALQFGLRRALYFLAQEPFAL